MLGNNIHSYYNNNNIMRALYVLLDVRLSSACIGASSLLANQGTPG